MTFTDKLQKFLDTIEDLPPSIASFRAMLALAFVTGACTHANGGVDDDELRTLTRDTIDQVDRWKGH